MLTENHFAILRTLLGRSTLQGTEVAAFVDLANQITELEHFLSLPKVQKLVAENALTARQ